MVLLFYILTNNVGEFWLLHILANIWCCQSLNLAFLVGVCWCLILVLFCIFLMTNDVKHFLNMLLNHLYIFLFEVFIQSFAILKIGFFTFLLLSVFFIYLMYKSFVRYVLQIFFPSLRSALIFLMVYLDEQNFQFWWRPIYQFE